MIMSHSGLCFIWDYVAFGIMSQSGLCHSGLCNLGLGRIRDYVIFGIQSFGIVSFVLMLLRFMSFGILSVYPATLCWSTLYCNGDCSTLLEHFICIMIMIAALYWCLLYSNIMAKQRLC